MDSDSNMLSKSDCELKTQLLNGDSTANKMNVPNDDLNKETMDSDDSLENLNIPSQSDNVINQDFLNANVTPTEMNVSNGNSIEDLNKKEMDPDGSPENLNIHSQSDNIIDSNSLNVDLSRNEMEISDSNFIGDLNEKVIDPDGSLENLNIRSQSDNIIDSNSLNVDLSLRNEMEISDGNFNGDLNEKNVSDIRNSDDDSNFVSASPIDNLEVSKDISVVNSKWNNLPEIHQSDDNSNLVNTNSTTDDVEISKDNSVVDGDLNDNDSLPDIPVSHIDDENRNLSTNGVSEMPSNESDMSDDENNENPNPTEDFSDSDREIDQPLSSRKKTSLPYFHLPNPDLDSYISDLGEEFQCTGKGKSSLNGKTSLSSTDKRDDIEFIIDLKENKTSFESKRSWRLPNHHDPVSSQVSSDVNRGASTSSSMNFMTPSLSTDEKGDIEFIIELKSNETSIESKRSFKLPNHPKTVSSEIISDDNGGANSSRNQNEYMKMFSSLNQMDNDKIPGFKRTALKDFLKMKIDEKKVQNFSKSIEISKIDEELDNEEFENIESDSEENLSDCEKSESVREKNYSDDEDDRNSLDDNPEENLFGFPASDNVRARNSGNVSPVSVLETDENVDSERIASPELLPVEQLNNEMHNESDDDDDFDKIKTKKVKSILEESEDESESEIENKEEIIPENSDINKVELLQRSNQLFGSSQISSSLPSYQPVRSSYNHIQNKDSETEDSDSESKVKHSQLKVTDVEDGSLSQFDLRPSSSFNGPAVSEDCESLPDLHSTPSFGLPLDNLPVTQASAFSSQDLMDICSGEFNNKICSEKVVDEQEFEDDSRSCISDDDNKGAALKIKDFIEDEAELSGDEMEHGDDDDEGSENDEELLKFCVQDTDLPSQEIIRDEIAGLHLKQMLNDDEEILQQFQERFIEEDESSTRKRKFAWESSENVDYKAGSSSDSDEENDVVDSWGTANQDKAKWRQENEVEDVPIDSDIKKKKFNISVLGQPQFSENKEFKQNPHKRPRGSFLIFKDDKASNVLKKITLTGDVEEASGSRTTRHFIFRNNTPSSNSKTKDNHVFQGISNKDKISINESIFKKI